MTESTLNGQRFSERLIQIIEANLQNEQFGVSELACAMGMSRSSLHRRVKNDTGLSTSQFIRQVRLTKALNLLEQNAITVSEAAYESGFQSVTYFTKCFHDFYGFSPGEVKKQLEKEKNRAPKPDLRLLKQKKWRLALVLLPLLIIVLLFTRQMLRFIPNHQLHESLYKIIKQYTMKTISIKISLHETALLYHLFPDPYRTASLSLYGAKQ